MVLSLEDIDNVLSTNARKTPPIPPQDTSETQSDPLNTEATEESASQQNSPFTTPTLDPALLTLSPQTPIRTTNPILHGEDLTQLARHLTLQKSLSKNSADELMLFAKRSLGEQLVWIAASQLSLAESVLAKHVKQEVGKRVLSPNLPAYKNEQLGFDLIKDALVMDQNSDVSEEALKDIDFCKKLKSAILTAWTKARSAVKTEVAQSLGDDPTTELSTEGVPNRRPSSICISELSVNILQAVPSAKGTKFSAILVGRVAFLRYCYTLSQDSKCDYWGLVDKKLEEIRDTAKDPNAISQKFTRILQLDQLMYGTADEAKRPLASCAPSTRRASGTAAIAGNKRKRI